MRRPPTLGETMNKRPHAHTLTLAALALAAFALPAQAQLYKCKHANGTTSYQEDPCEKGSTGDVVALPPVSTVSPPKVPKTQTSPSTRMRTSGSVRPDPEAERRNAEIEAHNRAVRCSNARGQADVMNSGRPVYRYDKDGNRQYVKDSDRDAAIAAANNRVAQECQ